MSFGLPYTGGAFGRQPIRPTPNPRSAEPELNIPAEYWQDTSFPHTEELLADRLSELYVCSESDREQFVNRVRASLACCNHIGAIAGVEMPTSVMQEAQQALST